MNSDLARTSPAQLCSSAEMAYRLQASGQVQSQLLAARALEPGDAVAAFRPLRSQPRPGQHTFQVGERDYVELDPTELTFVNHSCAAGASPSRSSIENQRLIEHKPALPLLS